MKRLIPFLLVTLLVTPTWAAGTVDHARWDRLLKTHVRGGAVDYDGFQKDEAELDKYLAALAAVDHQVLDRNERFAFWVNLYNAWTIKLILSKYPDLNSIKNLGSFLSSPWKKRIVRLKEGLFSLDYVEHERLRPEFKDPRVHFVVNCASKSCPPLAGEAYTGAKLEGQLERATQNFLNDRAQTRLEGKTLYLSKIFSWYKGDFGDRVAFVRKYAQGNLKKELDRLGGRVELSFLGYDWSLNRL